MSAPRKETLAEGVELWLGDCLEVLPTQPIFDLCLTDPPYGIGADKAASKNNGKWGWTYYGETDWDGERPSKSLFELILSRSKTQIIWGGELLHRPPSSVDAVACLGQGAARLLTSRLRVRVDIAEQGGARV